MQRPLLAKPLSRLLGEAIAIMKEQSLAKSLSRR
jgi:hypothetical protein